MTANLSHAVQRQLKRWYPLIDHDVQLALVDAVPNGVRFPLVPAGRRSGKTERFKRFISKQARMNPNEMYFAAAPTHAQAKKIFWNDLKKFTLSAAHPIRPSESELRINMPNGSEIYIIGLDKPERIEGIEWTGGGIDEFGNLKDDAWPLHIYPALNTVNPTRPDYRAFCWLLGVPEGLNFYFDLCQIAESGNDPDYKVFHWKSAEILPPDVIEAAMRTMSPAQFRQEWEASFETATGRIYSDYSKENLTNATIEPHEQLLWMHDQNYTPLSSAVGVRRGPKDKRGNYKHTNDLYLLDEIVLTSAVSRQSAVEFVEKFKTHENKHVIIYGDPAGKAGEKHGQESAYTEMEKVLRNHNWKYTRKVERKHPAIKDRQNNVRAKVKNAMGEVSLFVNPAMAKYCDKGLSTVQLKKGSTFLEDDTNEYQHITTAIGYMISVEWPIMKPAINIKVKFVS